ncbi:MAG TPA: trehalose-6-phosphate synthase [Herpetosiphonaceae bacterium]
MRLIIVSNRLPVTITPEGNGYMVQPSVGGLVSSLRSYLDQLPAAGSRITEYLWIGWPGRAVPSDQQAGLHAQLYQDVQAWPVFIEPAVMDAFYHGFCNKTLWPLPLPLLPHLHRLR